MPHVICHPAILYFGTPVVLIGTRNDDESLNLAPMSSAFWLGWRCVIGLAAQSRTTENLLRTGECVLNLPSTREAAQVDRLALTTGTPTVPASKLARGYRHEADKFGLAGFTPDPGQTVSAPRVRECPVQLEAVVAASHGLAEDDKHQRGHLRLFELRIQRVHLHPDLLMAGSTDRVDPDRWRPLIMSFQKFYGLGDAQLLPSTLASVPEAAYRSPDMVRAQAAAAAAAAAA